MPETAPVSPDPTLSTAELHIRRLSLASRLSLRIKDSGAGTPRPVAGLPLGQSINRFSAVDGRLAARLGPNEWLIVGAASEADNLLSDVTDALADRFHALVDVSQASVAFLVEGPHAENILNAGCSLDLDVPALSRGLGYANRSREMRGHPLSHEQSRIPR